MNRHIKPTTSIIKYIIANISLISGDIDEPFNDAKLADKAAIDAAIGFPYASIISRSFISSGGDIILVISLPSFL